MNDKIKEMTNEEYVEFLNIIETLPKKAQEIIRRGVLQLNDDKKQLFECIHDLQQELNRLTKDTQELMNERNNLQQENERLKEEINNISRISYKDYNVWLTERHYLDILEDFANDIKYKIAPNLTDAYRDGIKSALKHTIRYIKDNYKQEILEDYKSRCEKASEIIDNMINNG